MPATATTDDDLTLAIREVKILAAGKLLGLGELRYGVQPSPFRDDKKPSFSIYKGRNGGDRWHDHATGQDANLFGFVMEACPAWSKAQVAEAILKWSGREPGAHKITKARAAEAARKKEMAIDAGRRSDLRALPELSRSPAWAPEVAERFEEGVSHLAADEETADRIGDERGWFYNQTTEPLIKAGLMGKPRLPWSDGKDNRRGVAFVVQRPDWSDLARPKLVTVGYHQRWTFNDARSWLYVPYPPKKITGPFQRVLEGLGQKCHPYPFVIGKLQDPSIVVILEGQWDAVSFHTAAGGEDFDGLVFGIRGANSITPFLAAWGPWLRRRRPRVWMIGDADKAGRRWQHAEHRPGHWPEWSFLDRIRAMEPDRLAITFSKRGKDFNDYYREKYPTPDQMEAWMAKEGL